MPLLRTAADVGKDQSYVLSALAPASLARLRFPLGEHAQAAGARAGRARRAARSPAGATRRTCASWRAPATSAFLERHGGSASVPARSSTAAALCSASTAAPTPTPSASATASASPRHEPLYVLATDAHANTVTVGPRSALLARGVTVREATLHRDGRCVDGVRVRAHGRRFACRLSREHRAGRHARVAIELEEPAERTAPGQIACLYAGDLVVGHGTIACRRT